MFCDVMLVLKKYMEMGNAKSKKKKTNNITNMAYMSCQHEGESSWKDVIINYGKTEEKKKPWYKPD